MADINAGPVDTLLLGTANDNGTFTGVTTGTSAWVELGPHNTALLVWIGNGTISGGAAVLEEAHWSSTQMPYSGSWSNIKPAELTAIEVTGNSQKFIHLPNTAYRRMRVRIPSAITGGGGVSAVLKVL